MINTLTDNPSIFPNEMSLNIDEFEAKLVYITEYYGQEITVIKTVSMGN